MEGYIQSMNNSWDVTEDGQEDVDEKVGTTSTLKMLALRQ